MSKRIDIQPVTVKKPLVEQPLRVAAYCRVSTDSEEQLGSLESQIEFCTNYIHKQINWTLAGISTKQFVRFRWQRELIRHKIFFTIFIISKLLFDKSKNKNLNFPTLSSIIFLR